MILGSIIVGKYENMQRISGFQLLCVEWGTYLYVFLQYSLIHYIQPNCRILHYFFSSNLPDKTPIVKQLPKREISRGLHGMGGRCGSGEGEKNVMAVIQYFSAFLFKACIVRTH